MDRKSEIPSNVYLSSQSGRFSIKIGRRETELKSGRLPPKAVELTIV